jgi:oxygen-independent coproporphyrinogen-3 oxidase
MVKAIISEITLQAHYLLDSPLKSIYFGGGTPSLLSEEELSNILNAVHKHFKINPNAEITMEANPDDFSNLNLKEIRTLGINRLSIGIQSFHEPHLLFLNRLHNAKQAQKAINDAKDAGFDNLTIDLIYGIPAKNHEIWENDLQEALALQVNHISAYCLTIEEKTVFGKWVKQKKMMPIDETFAHQQFNILTEALEHAGYEQYEISNFARNKMYARHNSHYWTQGAYLGIGPSAHSYNGQSRQFNIAQNNSYLKTIQNGEVPFEKEDLSLTDKVNEYLMTHLRTQWGVNLNFIKEKFGQDLEVQYHSLIHHLEKENLLIKEKQTIFLTKKGKFLADEISAQLFI